MFKVHEYKQHLDDLLDYYEQRAINSNRSINEYRLKDLSVLRSIIKAENTIPLLNLKLRDYLSTMKNKGDVWTLYITQVSSSYLKTSILDFINYHEKVILLEDTLKTTSRLRRECEIIVNDQKKIIEELIEEHKQTLNKVKKNIDEDKFKKDVFYDIDDNTFRQSIDL